MQDGTHFLVVQGAKQPEPEHPGPNLIIVPEGSRVVRARCRF
jgi:hypothetical protein